LLSINTVLASFASESEEKPKVTLWARKTGGEADRQLCGVCRSVVSKAQQQGWAGGDGSVAT